MLAPWLLRGLPPPLQRADHMKKQTLTGSTVIYISFFKINYYWVKDMATPLFDISQLVGLLMQLLPFVIVLAILPLVIRLITGFVKE